MPDNWTPEMLVANYQLKGRLARTLTKMRDDGLSLRAIADALNARGVTVGYEGVRSWLTRIE